MPEPQTHDKLLAEIIARLSRLEALVAPRGMGGAPVMAPLTAESVPDGFFGIDKVTPTTPEKPSPWTGDNITVETIVDVDGNTKTQFIITFARVASATGGYVLSYRKDGTSDFYHIFAAQVPSGNVVIKTPPLQLDTICWFKVCSVNELGETSQWTDEVQKTSGKDTSPPSVPTGLVVTGMPNGLLISVDLPTAKDFKAHRIYISNTSSTTSLIDSYPEINCDFFTVLQALHPSAGGDRSSGGQCFTANDICKLTSAKFYLKKTGSPTGMAHAVLYAMTGTYGVSGKPTGPPLATSDDFDVSTLTTTPQLITFTFTGAQQHIMQPNTHYCIAYENPTAGTIDASNYVSYGVDTFGDATHSGNEFLFFNSSYTAYQYDDAIFYVYGVCEIETDSSVYLWKTTDYTLKYVWVSAVDFTGNESNKCAYQTATPLKIGTTNISDEAITTPLLVANAVIASKIAAEAVTAVKIKANEITGDKLVASAISARELAADSVIAAKIKAGEVSTGHIRFDSLTSEPGYESGKMWWRSDVDQLRFASGTTLDKVAIIPKEPLYNIQAPPESLIPNQCFEIDRDGDGIPDYWTDWGVWAGSGSRTMYIGSEKGGYSLKITADTSASNVGAGCNHIPIRGNQKYYVATRLICQYANNGDITIRVFWYTQNKTYISATEVVADGNGSGSWETKFGEIVAPATARFAKVFLQVQTPATAPAYILYDDVVLSELRAATGEIESTIILDTNDVTEKQFTTTYTKVRDDTCSTESEATNLASIKVTLQRGSSGGDALVRITVYDDTIDTWLVEWLVKIDAVLSLWTIVSTVPYNLSGHNIDIYAQTSSGTVYSLVNVKINQFKTHYHR